MATDKIYEAGRGSGCHRDPEKMAKFVKYLALQLMSKLPQGFRSL